MRNRLNYAMVVLLLAIAVAPLVLTLSYLIPAAVVRFANYGSDNASSAMESPTGGDAAMALASKREADHKLVLKLVPLTVVLLMAGLGLLLWGMSSSSTANLLAQMGARPAGSEGAEAEAARAIERLSRSKGLPPPKLYVAQCSFPSTFSSGANTRSAMVGVTTGALELLDAREVECLLAHELSHIGSHDGPLDSLLASVAEITEYPFHMFRRQMFSVPTGRVGLSRKLALLEMALSPLGLYIFFVSPLLNRMLSALVLSGRECEADASAALLTGNPESLVYALAKIGGVTSVLGSSTPASIPVHTSLPQRIDRLTKLYGTGFSGLGDAIAKGKEFARERPGMSDDQAGLPGSREHLAALNQGHVMGRVYRLMSSEAVPVYDKEGPRALLTARVKPNALLVAFDTPGKMRQVITADEKFGYIGREVKLRAVPGVLPQEVYDPRLRAAAEEALARQEAVTANEAPVVVAAQSGLTRQQLWITVGFGVAVFAGTSILLFVFTAH